MVRMVSRTGVSVADAALRTMVSLGRLEPERLNPEFLIRPVIVCPVNKGDAFEVVSALGYRYARPRLAPCPRLT